MSSIAHDDYMIGRFRKDPAYAIGLLNTILEDGDQKEFMDFLSLVAIALDEATPSVPAAVTPVVDIVSTLRRIGFRLAVVPLTSEPAAATTESKHPAEHPEPVMV